MVLVAGSLVVPLLADSLVRGIGMPDLTASLLLPGVGGGYPLKEIARVLNPGVLDRLR